MQETFADSIMYRTESKIVPLSRQFLESSIELIDAAFLRDPTLAWCLSAQTPGFDARRTNYLRSYLQYHHDASLPVLGVWVRDALVAVSYFTPGSTTENTSSLAELGHQIASGCGKRSLHRIDLLRRVVESKLTCLDCSRIEFIGVSPLMQGHGIGASLLRATLAYLHDIEPDKNVFLETGEVRNLPLYLRHGFSVRQRIGFPGLDQYLLQKDAVCGGLATSYE
ncbi:GNAT family N-acetyltransferase [Burkholderia cepacia]|uniref:GNAT family N-acetyltransferase n=1 Tax=Burkholderia cepacia TaxID=292 RepID=UPI00158CF904|nr:GNAT family N-acetyltransferase [Burkholderia cepacia]